MSVGALWRLMRFDRPIGIVLLWCPTAWALWVGNQGHPPFILVLYFLAGCILMRAAGCVINDIADRNIDGYVARTRTRPLAARLVSLPTAFVLLGALLLGALIILLQLPALCFSYAAIAVLLTFLYPFCKRFFKAPQLVLGLAFSMGIPMALLASKQPLNGVSFLIYFINVLWILAYDTMYAMADREDDLRLQVFSTAVLLGNKDVGFITSMLFFSHGLWLMVAQVLHYGLFFYWGWLFAWGFIIYQVQLIKNRAPEACLAAFKNNGLYGLWMWGVLILSA